ncbi:alpha/beta hydrolase [Actinomadura harenae]|uniref:Alpha/beta hydrolase n=1 Tax=Actinomadura harenae TaxID=2483351 RepID=A0A3M2LVS6_9ACTN|nr:alpha/beta hydrolase [Actinomadura harenae]RMI40115.1 alpha/beta hydrolase [Actinomadura harenae]
MGRTAGFAATAAALVAAVPLVSTPAQAASPAKITWKRCADDHSAQCGTLSVPIDRAHPKLGKVKLAVARAKATDPKHRLGTIFVNPGGPGGSSIDFVLDRAGLSREVRKRYDIVGFDPRGVGASHPVKCGKLGKAPALYPKNQAEFAKLKSYQRALYKACRKYTGPVYDHMGATDHARDMDAVRAALGEKKITYYGVSYGTWLGQRYAELYPGRLKALVVDGTMDHTVAGATRFSMDESRGLETAYAQFAKWCPTSKFCALRGKDPWKVLDGLMKRSSAGTLHDIDSSKIRLTPAGIAQMVRVTMYDPIAWNELSEELSYLSKQKVRKVSSPRAKASPDGRFAGIMCSDWTFPVRDHKALAAVWAANRKAAPHLGTSPLGYEAIVSCLGRPRGADRQRPVRIAPSVPVLVVGGVADPATVYPWAEGVNRQVRTSSLVTYQGTGHGLYGLSGCVRTSVDAFVLSGKRPAAGARCPAVMPDYSSQGQRRIPRDSREPLRF